MPVQTMAIDVLKKVSRQESYDGLNAMQVFIGLQTDFQYWYEQPIIYVSGDSTKDLLGKDVGTRAKMSDFYDEKGQYKLDYNMEQAHLKDPKMRNVLIKIL